MVPPRPTFLHFSVVFIYIYIRGSILALLLYIYIYICVYTIYSIQGCLFIYNIYIYTSLLIISVSYFLSDAVHFWCLRNDV